DERVFYASVVDKSGEPVPNLTEKDVIIREDGQAREILRVVPDTDPLQIALLVDNSEAIRNRVSDVRRAVRSFITHVRDGVPIALITLGERPTISVDYTTDRAKLLAGADRIFSLPSAGSYLLDAIAEASQGLMKRELRRSEIVAMVGTADLSYR